jgi:predicted MFS family arabinose efflux permease
MGVVFGTIINLFSLFAAPVAKELGATTGDFSLAYSVITLAALPMSPIIGNLLKRIDARILVSAGLIVAVLANLLLSSAKAMWMVYAQQSCRAWD